MANRLLKVLTPTGYELLEISPEGIVLQDESEITAFQASDADLTAIAALNSGTAGAIASDGAGWIHKTFAQFKTALGLVKADVGLGNVDNTSDTNKPVSTAQQTAIDLKTITVAEEGVDLATAATKLNFVGAGATASGTGSTKTITIPGGSGSASLNKPQGTFLRRYTFDTTTESWTIDAGSLAATSARLQITVPGAATNCFALEPSGAANIADGEVYADLFPVTPDAAGLHDMGIIFRATDANNNYLVAIRQGTNSAAIQQFVLYKRVAGAFTLIALTPAVVAGPINAPLSLGQASNARVLVRFVGQQISVFYNETFVLGAKDATYTTGRVGVRAAAAAQVAQFDNVSAYSLASSWTPANY